MQPIAVIKLLLFCLLIQTSRATDSNDNIFAKALQAQKDSHYTEAIYLYESLKNKNLTSSALHNNLGLSYIGKQQTGKAILEFERALKSSANNKDALHNLEVAQKAVEEQYTIAKPLFFVRWWNGISKSMTSPGWAILFLIQISIGSAALCYWRISKKRTFLKAGIMLLILSLLPLIFGFQQKSFESSKNTAILIVGHAGLRQSPDLAEKESEIIHEGSKVEILKQEGLWVHIRLQNNLIGWIPVKMLERI